MNHETFKVGEIAELVYSRYGNVGDECTVTGPLELRVNKHTKLEELAYAIDVQGRPFIAWPDQLRKKRLPPPQDWVSLCNLDVIPADELEIA